jgi:hypothetical protein
VTAQTTQTNYTCEEEIALAIKAYHEDSQVQSSKPIGAQTPLPGGVYDMILSWDRRQSYMRLEIPEVSGTWHFKKLQGQVQITGTDSERGRILLHGQARLDGEILSLYRDPASTPHPPLAAEDIGVELPPTNTRLCYYRQRHLWRVRDERLTKERGMNGKDTLRLVSGLVGDWASNKPSDDPIAHVFHRHPNYVLIDRDGVGHLYDVSL